MRTNGMTKANEIILITINGMDRPGVTAALTEILANNTLMQDFFQVY